MYQVVIDTNVIVAALRSKQGTSRRLLRLLEDGRWKPNVSVALALEYKYEEVLKREFMRPVIPPGGGRRMVGLPVQRVQPNRGSLHLAARIAGL
jgi:predicted nucleic acid-binding protein